MMMKVRPFLAKENGCYQPEQANAEVKALHCGLQWLFSSFILVRVLYLLVGLLVLPEEVVEDGAVLLVDALHLVDVLSHLLHADQRLDQVLLLIGALDGRKGREEHNYISRYFLSYSTYVLRVLTSEPCT